MSVQESASQVVVSTANPTYYHKVRGPNYFKVLSLLHQRLRPKTYLEIGTKTGNSFRLASCKAIAIDPRFVIRNDFQDIIGSKPACLLFQTTSDDFFASIDPKVFLGGPIDFAFIDGMHKFDFVLRDFMNIERHCRRGSVIAMHDVLPGELLIAVRDKKDSTRQQAQKPHWWAGDVWKVIPILQWLRPDLMISAVDSAPTGLLVVSNLDPGNQVLSTKYAEAVDKYLNEVSDCEMFEEFWRNLKITSFDELVQIIDRGLMPPAG